MEECTDSNAQRAVLMALATVMAGGRLELSDDAQAHLIACPMCNSCWQEWLAKAESSREFEEYHAIVKMAINGDTRVVGKETKQGFEIFKRLDAQSSEGIVVIVNPKNRSEIRSIESKVKYEDFCSRS